MAGSDPDLSKTSGMKGHLNDEMLDILKTRFLNRLGIKNSPNVPNTKSAPRFLLELYKRGHDGPTEDHETNSDRVILASPPDNGKKLSFLVGLQLHQ